MGYEDGEKMGEWSCLEACLDAELADSGEFPSVFDVDEIVLKEFVVQYKMAKKRKNFFRKKHADLLKNKKWMTREGVEIKIRDLTDVHLKNIFNMLSKSSYGYFRDKYLDMIQCEISKRGC